jgi:hypothetical protein
MGYGGSSENEETEEIFDNEELDGYMEYDEDSENEETEEIFDNEELDGLIEEELNILKEIHDLLIKHNMKPQNSVNEDKTERRKTIIYSSIEKEHKEENKADVEVVNPKKRKKFTNE